ncbi:putative signal transducing protein [Streptosporangium amethystogenes]|uniref:putative signal transducing protein n=1 Tax=Streptosporangium amethystogenes TaxID=2002 RepID=UPI0005690719|nr:DUF2007 domain-containing protein [Streptosporangium amethystogenes]
MLRTNGPVVLSLAAALLTESDVAHHVADDHLSDSSIGDLQPRLVADDQVMLARRILTGARILDKPLG